MTSITRIFGTDGIRGRAGEGWLSSANVCALGRAVASVLGTQAAGEGQGRVLIGHDGRRSGPGLQSALAGGLGERGFRATSAGLITTPGLALLTRKFPFQIGAMISASHNPPSDNGIKLFNSVGEKLSDEVEMSIEAALCAAPALPASELAPALDAALEEAYLAHLLEHAAKGLDLSGLALCIDCANGGGSRIGPRIFGLLGARVRAQSDAPDGDNINRDCGSTKPESLQQAVRSERADIGIALDGDGDRCILVDERGEVVHGDGILTVLACHAMSKGRLGDPRIVATVMSNRGLHRALRAAQVGVVTCQVGDRYVVEALRREQLALGGEQSGHIVFGGDNFHIGDGLYTALRVLAVMRETGRPLSELASAYQPFPQVLLNVPVKHKPPLTTLPHVQSLVSRIEADLGADGRVLLRYSGTENLARVMVEGPDGARIQAQAQAVADLLREALGA